MPLTSKIQLVDTTERLSLWWWSFLRNVLPKERHPSLRLEDFVRNLMVSIFIDSAASLNVVLRTLSMVVSGTVMSAGVL